MNPWETYTTDASPPPAEDRSILGEEIFWPSTAGTAGMAVTERTALTLPALLAVINVLATDVAALPCRVYRRRSDGGRDLAADHPVDDLLNVSPDGETTAICWRQALMVHALLYGNGYAEVQRRGRGTPAALHLLDPETTSAVRDPKTRKLRYEIEGGKKLDPENVFHLAGVGFDGVSGFNFIRLIKQAIGVGMAEEAFQGDFFANGSDPGGVIELAHKLDLAKRRELAADWQQRHKGPGKRHGVAVLEQGAKYTPTTVDPEKSQLLDSRKYQVLELARPWRVPPQKVGDYSQAHLANLEASNQDYLNTALMPWLIAFEQQALLKLLLPAERRAGVYVEHTLAALQRGDIKTRFNAYGMALRDGWMNRDEVRARENLSPIGEAAGGSKHTVQLNLTTLEKVGDDPSPDPVPVEPAEEPSHLTSEDPDNPPV